MAKGRRKRNKGRTIPGRAIALLIAVLVGGLLSVALLKQYTMATVRFSSNGTGYMCFLDYSDPATRGPLCLDDMNNNATIPFGNYTIVFFATKMLQGATFNGFLTTGGLSTGNWADYDQSFSYNATLSVRGDGTVGVLWSTVPIPEFLAAPATMIALIALATILVIGLKRDA